MENKLTNNKSRINWIDACKGFTIILVVIGHIADGYLSAGVFLTYNSILKYMRCLIYSFHMPLFFVVSGMTFYKAYAEKKRKERFICQVANLIWIYSVFSIIQWCVQKALSGNVNNSYSLYDLLLIPIKPIAIYWYLYVLIFSYIIAYKIIGNKCKNYIIFCVTVCVSLFAAFYKVNTMAFPLKMILYFNVFFWTGIISISNLDILKKKSIFTISLIISIISFAVTVIKGEVIGYWGNCIFPLAVCFLVSYLFFNIKVFNRQSILTILGKYSLEIYLFHCYITAGNRSFLPKMGIGNFWVNILVNFLMAISIPIFISKIIKKLKIYNYVFKLGSTLYDKYVIK